VTAARHRLTSLGSISSQSPASRTSSQTVIHYNLFHDLRVTVPVDAPELLKNTPLLMLDQHFPVHRHLLDLLSNNHVSIVRASFPALKNHEIFHILRISKQARAQNTLPFHNINLEFF